MCGDCFHVIAVCHVGAFASGNECVRGCSCQQCVRRALLPDWEPHGSLEGLVTLEDNHMEAT